MPGRKPSLTQPAFPPFKPGQKVWTDFTTLGDYKPYTVRRCYKAHYRCQSGWLVETVEGIHTSFRNWQRFYHGIDSDWFHHEKPDYE